jgi:predicted nucleic acid-binding protein
MDENKNKPIANIKIGSVRAAIWKNQRQNENGTSFESVKVVLDRTYKDRSGNYSSTHSLDVNDIPKAILALMKAYEYLIEGHEESDTAIEMK